MKSVIDIVHAYLTENGLDGLYSPDGCACQISDLAPCGEIQGDCRVGKKHIVTLEDIENGRYLHFIDPPSIEDIGQYWTIEPNSNNDE